MALFPLFASSSPATREFCLNQNEMIKQLTAELSKEAWLLGSLKAMQAECYIKGIGVEKNDVKGKLYLAEAAALGDLGAKHILASLKVFQSNDKQAQIEGLKTLKDEYESGSAFSAGKIGWAYNIGAGVSEDKEKAIKYYEIAANRGMTLWQYLLAHIYEKGYYGKKVDLSKVEYWKIFQPKIHVYTYECALSQLYSGEMSFPKNDALKDKYTKICNESS